MPSMSTRKLKLTYSHMGRTGPPKFGGTGTGGKLGKIKILRSTQNLHHMTGFDKYKQDEK
jgi:hypothetical protein